MNVDSKPDKGELVPSLDMSLAEKRSGLIRRGLDLVNEIKKPQIQVQIGDDFASGISEALIELIKFVIKDKYDLKFSVAGREDEVLKLADSGEIDIFIIVMNNFSVPDSIEDRMAKSLKLITKIKKTYGIPVIAMSGWGWIEVPSIITRAKLDADFFFVLPPESGAFMEAFGKCLGMC